MRRSGIAVSRGLTIFRWTGAERFGHKGAMLLALSLALAPVAEPAPLLAAAPSAGVAAAARDAQGRYIVRIPLPPPAPRVDLPPVRGPKDPALPLVVIDAGHGGHDPGAISPGKTVREKEVTLALARSIRDTLLADGKVRVALTRDSDRYLVLRERYEIARRLNADLFISIHADAASNPEAQGATVYTLSEVASDREASRLAARENRADVLGAVNLADRSSAVSSILIDLTQRETLQWSAEFVRLLIDEGQGRIDFRPESHRFASFVVLKAPDVPSVLFEAGYLSNQADVERLASRAARQGMADAIARAVTRFMGRRVARR